MARSPPADVDELIARARALAGTTVGAIGRELGADTTREAVRAKGSAGAILERALGASGSGRTHDFPALGVELKTVPVSESGVPFESTYVCTLSLGDVDGQSWETSWARAKLGRVLFVPLVGPADAPWSQRRVAAPVLWSPTGAQDAMLRADFDDIVGLVAVGRIEELDAHRGRWMQVRPKARDGRARTVAWGDDGEAIATVPRGFYLRARFTRALLLDPTAVPDAFAGR